jgi:fructosamine-3-kinase
VANGRPSALLEHQAHVERIVRERLGRPWRIDVVRDLSDRACHPAAVLSDGAYPVFAKLGRGDPAGDRHEREVANLAMLANRAGVPTPSVIARLPVDGGEILLMEAVEEVEPGPEHWRAFGDALARIHTVEGHAFGLGTHGYWGDLRQENGWFEAWPEFFWTRRIEPRVRAVRDLGRLPAEIARGIGRIGARFDALCGPRVAPVLLHGDAHRNNVLATPDGPVFIDPAPYYGHPEVDLAYTDMFSPVGPELFRAYAAARPLDPGFPDRRELWRIPFHLAMVEVEGEQHLGRLAEAVARYS